MSKEDFIKFLIQWAKHHPNKWLSSHFEVNGKNVPIKAFGKWVQVAHIPSPMHESGYYKAGTADCKTYKKYKEELEILFKGL